MNKEDLIVLWTDNKELIVLWIGILAVLLTIAFPPYGYDKFRYVYTSPTLNTDEIVTISFRYIGHFFIFSAPLQDENLNKFGLSIPFHYTHRTPYIRIAWHILAGQLLAIVIVTGGVLITIRKGWKLTSPNS